MRQKPLNRKSLKSLFKDGERPNASNFESLIDSMINKADDGISINFTDGLTLTPEGKNALGQKSDRVLSFKENSLKNLPDWGIELDDKGLSFIEPISEKETQTHLFFQKGGNIGVGTITPQSSFEVNGILGTTSRVGTYKLDTIPADGNWYDIITNLDGYNAFEIVAQVGIKGSGKHALLHAHALSTYGRSRNRIRKTQAHYGWWWNKLSLRWTGSTHNYRLQMRSRTNYGASHKIKYYVTKLWDSEIMSLFNKE
jgi:hypothetical protein